MLDTTLFPQDEQEQPTGLFEPEEQQRTVVPRNAVELAAQLAMVDEDELEMPFTDRLSKRAQDIETHGADPLIADIANKEREDTLRALEMQADEAARRGDSVGLEGALRLIQTQRERHAIPPTSVEGHTALATRALEALSPADYLVRKYKDAAVAADRLTAEGDYLSLRNVMHQKMAELEEVTPFGAKVRQFLTQLVPFADMALTHSALSEIGVAGVEEFRTFWMGLQPDERAKTMELLLKTSDNPARTIELLRKIADATRGDHVMDMAFNVLGVADVAAIAKGVSWLMRRGAPVNVINNTAGPEAAAQVAVPDLLNGTQVGGLNNDELMGKMLSFGTNPVDLGMAEGMSAAAQAELRSTWNKLLDDAHNRLPSSGLTPQERADGLARIRELWTRNTNPQVHSVVFGEGDDFGQKLNVYWQGTDGKAFSSKEAAEAWAKAEGKVAYQVVPESSLRTNHVTFLPDQTLHHGSVDLFEEVAPHFIGRNGTAIGHGFYATAMEAIAKRIAAGKATREGAEKGFIYKVQVPDEKFFMDWNAPLSKQTPEVQKALRTLQAGLAAHAVKFKPEQTGEAIYRQLSKVLGGDERASTTLDRAGVRGNVVREKGIWGDEQHVIFNSKNVQMVERGEVPRNPRDEAFEEEARQADDWFLENVKMAHQDVAGKSGDNLKEVLRLVQESVIPNKAAKTAVSRGDPLFVNGRHLEFSDNIHPKYQALVKDWVEMLGMQGEDLVFVTEKDLFRVGRALGLPASEMTRGYNLIANGSAHGFYSRMPGGIHLIGMRAGQDKFRNWIATASHEMGHMFDVAILSRAPKAVVQEMRREFAAFLASNHKKPLSEFYAKFRTPVPHNLEQLPRIEAQGRVISTDRDLGWYSDLGEWWAENFSKFMMTDAKPVSVLEKWFYEHAQKLKAFFRKVAEVLGMDTSTPATSVDMFLKRYLDDPKSIEWKEAADSLFGTMSADTTALPKPRIKGKSKPHLKGPAATASPAEGWLVLEKRTDPISTESVGRFTEEDIKSMPTVALDPKHQASELGVAERVIGVHAEAKTRKDMIQTLAPFFDRLSNASKAKVKAVLEEGDAYSNPGGVTGKEFNYQELVARGLNEKEAAAYFAARQVRMMSYHLRNGEMVRALRAEGLREVELLGTGEKYAGRMLEQQDAGRALGKVVYDTVTKEKVVVDSDVLASAYAGGKRVVQLKAPADMADGRSYTMLLADDTTVKARDIHTALHYRPGEFSRIYSDEYFITVKRVKEVDGAMAEVTETVRTAASVREAKEFVEAHRAAIRLLLDAGTGVPRNIDEELERLVGRYTDPASLKQQFAAGELDGFVDMDFHFTRNKEEYLNGSINEAIATGRLFTSKRSEKLFSVDASRSNTLDVFQSLEAEISNISRVANINMWRETMIRKWMNTFGHMIPNRSGNDVADFFAAAGAKFTSGTPEAMFAQRTHNYIMRQVGVRTDEEQFYEGVTRTLTEKLFAGNERVETIGAKVRQMSWMGFARSVNFNLMLGMFNPAQLLVQANGAATAVILSPLHGLKAAKTFPLLRLALMSDNPQVWNRIAKLQKFSDLGLSNTDEFVKLIKAIRTSGIIDNIKSTALWNLEDGALNVFKGYAKRQGYGHSFFFNRGEEFSRVVSFDVARREWMAANPGAAWDSKEALKQIVVRMDDLTQNMTKANLARWQTGAASIPLQFTQYMLKFTNNVVGAFLVKGKGRGFSRAEAAKLMIGHVLFYGAAGNGLMLLADEMFGDDAAQLSPEAKYAIAQGAVGWAFDSIHQVLTGEGAKPSLAPRFGVFEWWQQVADAAFRGEASSVYSALLGPTAGTAERLGAIGEIVGLWRKDPDLTIQDVLEGLAMMGAEQASSTRNAMKAYLYFQHQNKLISRSGVPMAQLNSNEVLWQALGFAPAVHQDIHRLIQTKKDHGDALDDLAKQVLRTQRDIVGALNRGDVERAQGYKKLLQALWPENVGDFMEVQRRVRDRLFPYDNEMQKLLGEYMWKGSSQEKPMIVNEQPKKAE